MIKILLNLKILYEYLNILLNIYSLKNFKIKNFEKLIFINLKKIIWIQ
jgi:hypothetical protein